MKGIAALASFALSHSMIPREFDAREVPQHEQPKRDPERDAERIAAAEAKRQRRMERNRRLLTK